MAKRFTDTLKWKDDWYQSLSNDYKIVWQWLLDECDHVGILKRNIRDLNYYCNTSINEENLKEVFAGRVYILDKIYFIPKFLKFQYEQGLNSFKPVIKSVRERLFSMNLHVMVNELYGNDFLMVNEPFLNDCIIIKEKEKDKDKDKSKDKEKEIKGVKGEKEKKDEPVIEVEPSPSFSDFWDLYDKKIDSRVCEKKWNSLKQREKERIMEYLPSYISTTLDKQIRKNPETFLNRRAWENELIQPITQKPPNQFIKNEGKSVIELRSEQNQEMKNHWKAVYGDQ